MSIEDELHDRLRGVRLVLEIGLDAETVRRATEVVSQIAIRAPTPEETLGTRVPATLAAFLVSLGVERYDGSLWPHLPVKGLDSTKLGQAFLAAIDDLDLEPFDGLGEDLGYRYITRILAHGGIPKYSTRDYLRLVRDELRRHPGASADELVALWRTRRTAFANIDEPVRRFLLYGGGVAVDFLDRTIELLQIPPSETALSMAETIGLPDYILAEHCRTPAAALQRAGQAASAPRLPRPLVRFDPWGGIGPVVELPAVGARYRNAAWQVASDSRTRILDASLIETRIVPLDPAGSWEVGFDDGSGLGRTYAYECLGTSPLICFDPAAGAYVSDTRPVALDHVWVIVPRDAQLTGIDGSGATVEIPVRAELPALSGAWTGFTARHLGLDGMRAIHARLETPGAELVESWTHVVRSADRPAVVGSAIDHVTGDVGEAVYGAMPRLRVPVVAGFGDDRWTVAIKGPGFEMSGSVADLGRQGDSVSIPAPGGPIAGAFDVSVRGPLGSDLRTRFFLVSGLRVETPTKVLLPDDRSPTFVDAEAAPGIAIAGATGGKARIAVPHDGTDLSLEVSSAHGAATLHVRLPRLQWGLKRRSALPTLSASRIRIERDDLESGEAESVVVATHRAGIPMVVELWGDDGVHQSSSEGISSPGDGRWVFALDQFIATVCADQNPHLRLHLRIAGDSVVLADIVASVGADEFSARPTMDATPGTAITYRQSRDLRHRVARLWALQRPWDCAIEIPIADEAPPAFVVPAELAPPGWYRVEIAVDDGWTAAKRPRKGSPGAGDLLIGSQVDADERQLGLASKGPLGWLEIAVLAGTTPSEFQEAIPDDVVPCAFDGALARLGDEEDEHISRATRALAQIAFSNPASLLSVVAARFSGELVSREELTRFLLVAMPSLPVMHTTTVDSRHLRTIWQACPPLAAAFDIWKAEQVGGEAADRCEQFLGWRPGQSLDTRPGLKLTELELRAGQLRALQIGLGLIPRGVLTWDTWAFATFQWLLLQREERALGDWWRQYGWLATASIDDDETLFQAVSNRKPDKHPDPWSAFPQATLSAALHLTRQDADREGASRALLAAVRLGAGRIVLHDLCVARALVPASGHAGDDAEWTVDGADPASGVEVVPGDVVHGRVIRHVNEGAFVDIGPGPDAFLFDTGFARDDAGSPVRPEVGEAVDAIVTSTEARTGNVRISVRALLARDRLSTLSVGDKLHGRIEAHVEGGLFVDLGFLTGFLPENERTHPGSARPVVGREVELSVKSVDPDRGYIRLTEKDLEATARLLDTLNVGDLVRGRIAEVTELGLFVDLGPLEGLVYASRLPRLADGSPNWDFSVGQEVEPEVTIISRSRGQIGLSLRHLERPWWEEAVAELGLGAIVDVTIVSFAQFGVFVSVSGVTGFVHASELSWNRAVRPADFEPGQTLPALVVSVDHERMRVTLSLKQLQDDPFPSGVEGLRPGDAVRGTVTSVVNFGAFVRLPSDLDALLHISELPDAPGEGDAPTEFISRYVEVGAQLSTRIVAIELDKHRVSLTIRRPHPWLDNVGLPAPGDLVEGSVSRATGRGALVELVSRVLGLIPVSQLELAESGEDDIAKIVGEVLPTGIRVVAEVDRLDRNERVVILRRPSIIPAE